MWLNFCKQKRVLSCNTYSEYFLPVTSSTFTGSLSGIVERIESHVNDLHQRRAVGMSSMKVIETAIVADKQTLDYHGSQANLVAYVLDVMQLVSTRS